MKVLNTFVGLICLLPSFVFAKHTLLNKNGEIYIKLDDASKINQALTNEILEKIEKDIESGHDFEVIDVEAVESTVQRAVATRTR